MPAHSKQSKAQDNKARMMTDRKELVYGLCYLTIISALETILSGRLRVSFYTPALLPAPAHLRAGKDERRQGDLIGLPGACQLVLHSGFALAA